MSDHIHFPTYVQKRFRHNYSASNGSYMAYTLPPLRSIRMKLVRGRSERHCCYCGLTIQPEEKHYAADVYRLHVNCGETLEASDG